MLVSGNENNVTTSFPLNVVRAINGSIILLSRRELQFMISLL